MRISDTKVCQLIESEPPTVVIVDESDGTEITLSRSEAAMMLLALDQFLNHMGTASAPQHGYHSWSPEERAEYDAMYDR